MTLILILLMTACANPSDNSPILFDTENSSVDNWKVVNDGVMGGLSKGHVKPTDEGMTEFYGHVSTKNNGGFTMITYPLNNKSVEEYSEIKLKLKGDGAQYQFRIKEFESDDHSYIYSFNTSGESEIITIKLEDMYPSYRGKKLNMPNFDKNKINQLAILIGNKKEQDFNLVIEEIWLA